eukprot:gene19684-23545_t
MEDAEHVSAATGDNGADLCGIEVLQMPEGVWKPLNKWEHAIYKGRKNALAVWEVSWERFQRRDTLEGIAITQPSGKPVRPSTIFSHILTALEFGKPVNLSQLMDQYSASTGYRVLGTRAAWDALENAAAIADVDPTEKDAFAGKDILRVLLGADK